MSALRRYFIAGLLVWVPLGITVLLIKFLVEVMDQTLLLLPEDYRPEALFGFSIPGLGVVVSVALLLFTGMIAANLFGRKLVQLWEALLARIPLVRTIYAGAKQVLETVFSSNGKSFRKVLMIEYPRKGIWTLAFQTGDEARELSARTGEELVTVFLPTTPNPTSGFILAVPRKDVIELDMSVDQGLRMIITLGVVVPPWQGGAPVAPPAANP